MDQKHEMKSAEIERILAAMAANNTMDVTLTDADLSLITANTTSTQRAEPLAARALSKMQDAQSKREQKLPSFTLGQFLANARLSAGLTQSQIAQHVSMSEIDLEQLESGSLGLEQIMQQFPVAIMKRLLTAAHIAVQDFSDELLGITNQAALKLSRSSMYARSHQSSNTKSARLIAEVAEYISDLQRLSS